EILTDISFTLRAGERLCVVGPNGSGKTTLLRVLSGNLPYRGSLSIRAQDPKLRAHAHAESEGEMTERSRLSRRAAARETGFLAQLSSAYFPFTVGETVMLGRYARQRRALFALPSDLDRETLARALEACGIADIQDERLSCLSGGQLQRVFLARAFAQDPSILLLDEPSNHLDLYYQLGLLRSVESWVRGGTVRGDSEPTADVKSSNPATAAEVDDETSRAHAAIGVFHDLSLALRFADSLILLDGGRITDSGDPRAVLSGDAINRAYRMDVARAMRDLLQSW
ncbi:MAG TPA: ABC transporter ATP-binding protein, partial [Treponemataceae bacterium]|nr:ABC transporter ATP-binding protein [Treponemataceae bacterium]